VADEVDQQPWRGLPGGDAAAWRRFLLKEIPRLYGIFMKRWPNPSLAEELVQKTVYDAVRGRNTYDPARGGPEGWIAGIARNNIRLEIRKRAAAPSVNGDVTKYLGAIDSRPLPDQVLERQETATVVRQALARLPAKERTVLKCKYLEDSPVRAIAQQMGLTEKAVHNLLYRARISLRKELQYRSPSEQKEA
jgi:RNA polymerase sigma factor (sigma-70 family)